MVIYNCDLCKLLNLKVILHDTKIQKNIKIIKLIMRIMKKKE